MHGRYPSSSAIRSTVRPSGGPTSSIARVCSTPRLRRPAPHGGSGRAAAAGGYSPVTGMQGSGPAPPASGTAGSRLSADGCCRNRNRLNRSIRAGRTNVGQTGRGYGASTPTGHAGQRSRSPRTEHPPVGQPGRSGDLSAACARHGGHTDPRGGRRGPDRDRLIRSDTSRSSPRSSGTAPRRSCGRRTC